MKDLNRREFIAALGMMYGSLLIVPSCKPSEIKEDYQSFTQEEADCLKALCDQLIPADEYPGATQAGVIHFIDRQLKMRFPKERVLFKNGIAMLQVWCKTTYNQPFEKLDADTQIAVMQRMEKDEVKVDNLDVSSAAFFGKLLARTMQGFYGSPRHGGNKDYISFRMMKLDYPTLMGQNRYKTNNIQ
ncbi:MAG: gluconate 2-dehydrogenase subunit 3 family protein [Tannerella sp.]|jgi:gluconate 2-dehydrogenase gamma chain|nr:gluconate 2-dehydrogenase subunit 3 family protein [Tannerella sp.]